MKLLIKLPGERINAFELISGEIIGKPRVKIVGKQRLIDLGRKS